MGDPFWETNLGEKRSHAAWRSFLGFPKRSHAARRSFWSTKRYENNGLGVQHSFRGSLGRALGESFWDAFSPYRFTTYFSESLYNPLQAVYSFEKNGFIQKGVLRGIPVGNVLNRSRKSLGTSFVKSLEKARELFSSRV